MLVPFHWGSDQKQTLMEIKESVTMAPELELLYYNKEIVLETDASSYKSAGVVSQYDNQEILYQVAFFANIHQLRRIMRFIIKNWKPSSKASISGEWNARTYCIQ